MTVVLLNEAAGGGRAGARWARLAARFPELREFELLRPASVAAAHEMLTERMATLERLLVVGGDGSAHLAVQAILNAGRGHDVELGVIPAGTGSDFARALGLPKRLDAICRQVLAATARPIDAIEVVTAGGERRFCLNIASVGLSGAVDLAVNAQPGRGSYLAATLGALVRYRPLPCRVEADGEILVDGPFFVAAIANGKYFGKGMKVAPGASIDDGLLDVVVVPPVPLWQLPWRLPQFLTGSHVTLPQVSVRRAREVRVFPPSQFFPFDLDGETLEADAATFRVLPAALRLLS